jgi:hypothetical protein
MHGCAAGSAVTLDADLFHAGQAVRWVERFDHTALPSRTRRAFYLIEAARAHQQRRDNVATMHLLGWALRESTETVRSWRAHHRFWLACRPIRIR